MEMACARKTGYHPYFCTLKSMNTNSYIQSTKVDRTKADRWIISPGVLSRETYIKLVSVKIIIIGDACLSQWFNTLRLRQDGRLVCKRHFQVDFLECKCMNVD